MTSKNVRDMSGSDKKEGIMDKIQIKKRLNQLIYEVNGFTQAGRLDGELYNVLLDRCVDELCSAHRIDRIKRIQEG